MYSGDCSGPATFIPDQRELLATFPRLDACREPHLAGGAGQGTVFGGIGRQLVQRQGQGQRKIRPDRQVLDLEVNAAAVHEVRFERALDETSGWRPASRSR